MVRIAKFVSALLLAAVALSSAGLVSAQTGPTAPPANPMVQPGPGTVGGISEADLLTALKALDPNVKTTAIKDGTEYRLTIQRDGWQFQIRVTSFKTEVWFDAELGDAIADIKKVPAANVVQIMQENYKIGPTHFALAPTSDNKVRLVLGRNRERSTMTAEYLREQVELFCKQIRDTYPAWSAFNAAAK